MSESEGAPAEKAKSESKAATTYSVERLIADAPAFLGVPSHVAVGAFYGAKKKNFTVAEAKKLCDEWLSKPAKPEEKEAES